MGLRDALNLQVGGLIPGHDESSILGFFCVSFFSSFFGAILKAFC